MSNNNSTRNGNTKRRNTEKYGIFYKSNGKWVGPYHGKTMTLTGWNRFPQNVTLLELRNKILKSPIELRKVG